MVFLVLVLGFEKGREGVLRLGWIAWRWRDIFIIFGPVVYCLLSARTVDEE